MTNLKTKTELKDFWREQWIDTNKNIGDITKPVCREDSELLGFRQSSEGSVENSEGKAQKSLCLSYCIWIRA